MSWVYRKKDQHKCLLPDLDDTVRVGDLWRCDGGCGTFYIVLEHQLDGIYMAPATEEQIKSRLPDWER